MLNRFIIINLFFLSTILGSSPAKPGVIASTKVKQYTTIMSNDYAQGGLVTRMQAVKDANVHLAKSGSRELREDIYLSFPVILGSYADSDDLDTVVSMLQQELFDGPWPSITMAEHYAEMSYDQFHLSGMVYGWYELAENSDYYEGSQSEPYDNGFSTPPGGTGSFLREALDQADLEIDFTQYDSDGPDGIPNSGDDDGYVDAAFFVHSGRGGEGGGPYIWSHRWTYSGWWGSPYTTDDIGANGSAIRVNDYIIQPAAGTGGGLIEIGVFSHEFGHALGLPDLYDTDYSSNGVGSWCLMASGSWSTPSSPTHFSAWCKEMMGWIVPVLPNQNIDTLEFPNAEQYPFAVKLWTRGDLAPYVGSYSHGQDVGQEYFLIENRQRIGSEQYLPGTGLLIWHIDNSLWTNSNENHRMVDVIAADGNFNGSNSGDPWPGSTNNRNFDYETTPPAIGWAGVNTEVAVLNVSDSDSTMWADVEVHEINPHISIVDMLMSDSNGDQIYAPGENVLIWLIVQNSGGTANNLVATLSVNGAPVELLNEVVDFDSIGFMETSTSNLAFEFNVDMDIAPQSATFDITFISEEILEAQHHELTLMLGWPELAIIDDDGVISGSGDYSEYYSRALDIAEEVYAVWDIAEHGIPSLEWLQVNSKVIWFTGDNETPLDSEKIDLVAAYLGGGGKILMSGQDIFNENSANFLGEFFAVEVVSEDVNTSYVYGDVEHEIMSITDRYSISNADGAHNQTSPDAFNILQGGSSLFVYPFSGNLACAASVKTSVYSTILLGFGFESLAAFDGSADTVRSELMGRMLSWLDLAYTEVIGVELNLPGGFGLTSIYPNPFNPTVLFDVQLQEGVEGELQIIDLRGSKVRTIEVNQSGQVSWTPEARDASGVYFINLMIEGRAVSMWDKITYLK